MRSEAVSFIDALLSDEAGSPYVSRGGDLHLSNPGQRELLLAMVARGVPLRTLARGFSMHPFIRDRDVLTISPIKDRPLSLGEVVAFTQPAKGRLAIHRIIQKTEKGWLIRGDNCPEPDGVVAVEEIIGRVSRVERAGRDIHLGIGGAGKLIALLNRGRMLMYLKQIWMLPRRVASHALHAIQSLAVYRRLGRRLAPPATISVADENDMEAVHDRLNPFSPYRKEKPDPNVANFVAKNKEDLTGFVQLVYHPAGLTPWVGYWLFSLHVWTIYRGMGTGNSLTRRVIDEAAARGAKEILLAVYEDNKRAIRMYRNFGFEISISPGLEPVLAEEKRQTGRRRIVMRKELR